MKNKIIKKFNKPTCPFCGKNVSEPRPLMHKPFGVTGQVFTAFITECLHCQVEIIVDIDEHYNIVNASVEPLPFYNNSDNLFKNHLIDF